MTYLLFPKAVRSLGGGVKEPHAAPEQRVADPWTGRKMSTVGR